MYLPGSGLTYPRHGTTDPMTKSKNGGISLCLDLFDGCALLRSIQFNSAIFGVQKH